MVNNFQDLIEKIPVLTLPNKWMICHSDCDALHIYKSEFSNQGMKIQACLKIARNLRIFSFRDNLSIPLTLDVLSDIRSGGASSPGLMGLNWAATIFGGAERLLKVIESKYND